MYHDTEVLALVTGFCWEQGRVVQQLLKQFCCFGQMFLLVAELALAAHTQQSVHLTLVTCTEREVGHTWRKASATAFKREGCLTQLEQDLLPSRAYFSPSIAQSVYVVVELLPLLKQAIYIYRLTKLKNILL